MNSCVLTRHDSHKYAGEVWRFRGTIEHANQHACPLLSHNTLCPGNLGNHSHDGSAYFLPERKRKNITQEFQGMTALHQSMGHDGDCCPNDNKQSRHPQKKLQNRYGDKTEY